MNDIIPAFCVGVTQIAVGHPFDTIKVLIQTNRKWVGLSLKSYYRGWKYPLIASTLFNCTVFPVYERSFKYTNNSLLSGCIAGIAVSPAIYFFDTFKIKKQINQKATLSTFKRPMYGLHTTFAREIPAMSAYFGSYFFFKEHGYNPLISGGLAGLANWTLTYPLDVIRSRQIAQHISIKEAIKMGKLWKGYNICAIRAVIVNAANFWVYEKIKYLLT